MGRGVEAYLREIGVVGMRSDSEHDPFKGARFDNEIRKLKKQISRIDALAEKIIFLLVINVVVMIMISIVLLCALTYLCKNVCKR